MIPFALMLNQPGVSTTPTLPVSGAVHWFDFSRNDDTISGGILTVGYNYGSSGYNIINNKPTNTYITKTQSANGAGNNTQWAYFSGGDAFLGTWSSSGGEGYWTASLPYSREGTHFAVFKGYPYFVYSMGTQSSDYAVTTGTQLKIYLDRYQFINYDNYNPLGGGDRTHRGITASSYATSSVLITTHKYYRGLSQSCEINGSLMTYDPLGGGGFQAGISLGYTPDTRYLWFGEYIYYDFELTDSQINSVENYLKSKWEVTY